MRALNAFAGSHNTMRLVFRGLSITSRPEIDVVEGSRPFRAKSGGFVLKL
jgi:hypothetical protein